MINSDKEQILDEDSVALSLRWLEKIRAQRRFWGRWCLISALIFAIPFCLDVLIAYKHTPDDLARVYGLGDGDTARGIFLTFFLAALLGFIFLVIGVMRQAFLPYLPTLSEGQCRAQASGRMRAAFAVALVLLLLPLWLYFNMELISFGRLIGVPPGRQSGGTSEVLLGASIALGLLALFRAAVYARRRHSYQHPSIKL